MDSRKLARAGIALAFTISLIFLLALPKIAQSQESSCVCTSPCMCPEEICYGPEGCIGGCRCEDGGGGSGGTPQPTPPGGGQFTFGWQFNLSLHSIRAIISLPPTLWR
jgi:hypothetical protein